MVRPRADRHMRREPRRRRSKRRATATPYFSATIEAQSRETFGKDFVSATADERLDLLKTLDALLGYLALHRQLVKLAGLHWLTIHQWKYGGLCHVMAGAAITMVSVLAERD